MAGKRIPYMQNQLVHCYWVQAVSAASLTQNAHTLCHVANVRKQQRRITASVSPRSPKKHLIRTDRPHETTLPNTGEGSTKSILVIGKRSRSRPLSARRSGRRRCQCQCHVCYRMMPEIAEIDHEVCVCHSETKPPSCHGPPLMESPDGYDGHQASGAV